MTINPQKKRQDRIHPFSTFFWGTSRAVHKLRDPSFPTDSAVPDARERVLSGEDGDNTKDGAVSQNLP